MEVRPFARRDREQLRELATAHAGTATPGASIPAATILNQLEHPLGEYVIGPWVTDLVTFVAVERDRIVGAAHLRRYADDERVSDSYRDVGEIVWLLSWPDHLDAGRAVRDRALDHLAHWGVRLWYGDGSLPAPGVYGVSDSWPHVQLVYEEAGFDADEGQVEIVYAGMLCHFPEAGPPPLPELHLRRQLGPSRPRSTPSSTASSWAPTRSIRTSHEGEPTWPSRAGPTNATTGCVTTSAVAASAPGSSARPRSG